MVTSKIWDQAGMITARADLGMSILYRQGGFRLA